MTWKRANRMVALTCLIGLSFLGAAYAVVYLWPVRGTFRRPVVVFRYDDYSEPSHFHIDREIIKIMQEYKVQCTFGVIPFPASNAISAAGRAGLNPLTDEQVQVLRRAVQSGAVDVALHGFRHDVSPENPRTEYAGRPYAQQYRQMAKGKAALKEGIGVKVRTLIPTFNRYDVDTLRAMSDSGLTCLAATPSRRVETSGTIRYLPGTCSLDQVNSAVDAALEHPDGESTIIVCLFHWYDFVESGRKDAKFSMRKFRALLGWLSVEEVNLLSIGQVLDTPANLTGARQMANRLGDLVPPTFLRPHPALYLPVWACNRILIKSVLVYLALGLAAFSAAFALTGSVARGRRRPVLIAAALMSIALAGAMAYLVPHISKQGGCLLAVVFLMGILSGTLATLYPGWKAARAPEENPERSQEAALIG